MTTLQERRHAMGDANADGVLTAQEITDALNDGQITAIDQLFMLRLDEDVDLARRILDYRINMALGRGDSDQEMHDYLENAFRRIPLIAMNPHNFQDLDFRETLMSINEFQAPEASNVGAFSRLVVHDTTLNEAMEGMGLTPRTAPLRDTGPILDV